MAYDKAGHEEQITRDSYHDHSGQSLNDDDETRYCAWAGFEHEALVLSSTRRRY